MRSFVMAIVHAGLAATMCLTAASTAVGQTPQRTQASKLKLPAATSSEGLSDTRPSQLAVVAKNDGTGPDDLRFKMGESLTIKATGDYASKIRSELAKAASSRALTLYLDNVRMVGLRFSASETDSADAVRVMFHLERNSNDDENRTAWDTLLRKKEFGVYTMRFEVALAIGGELPVPVQAGSLERIEFFIAKGPHVTLIVVLGGIMFFGSYSFFIWNKTILRDYQNGPYSLGKSQMAFWGLLVALSFAGIWFVTFTMERIPPQVLILLGISGATGLGAVVIGGSKNANALTDAQAKIAALREEQQRISAGGLAAAVANQTRVKEIKTELEKLNKQLGDVQSPPVDTECKHFFRDICGDQNGLSLHRLQVVVWTVMLGVVFVYSVASMMSMPEFSETLLILLGISNGTYLGFKIPE